MKTTTYGLTKPSRWVFPSLVVILIAACGGSGGGGSTPTEPTVPAPTATTADLSGSVVKGPVVGATITFFALNPDGSKGAQLGATTTDSSGNFTVTLSPAPTTPFLAQSSGGSYVDEATGSTTTLAATDTLTAVLPAGTTSATVTPLTHIAAARAIAAAANGTPSAAQLVTAVNSSNNGVAQQYNVADIVKTLPPPADDATRMATATLAERQYALVLAGFAQSASTIGIRPLDLATALATDAKDGTLDGTNGGKAIVAGASYTLPKIAGTTEIQTAIDAFIRSTRNKSGQNQMPITPNSVNIGVNTTTLLYPTVPVLPAAISGEAYSADITVAGGTGPYACALKGGSSLPAGYQLVGCKIVGTGSGTTMTISTGFTIVVTDSAKPPVTTELNYFLTTDIPAPTIAVNAGDCTEGTICKWPAPTVTGGTGPYSFKFNSFIFGTPPLGSTIDLFTGVVTIPANAKAGTYKFSICVVDLGGRSSCTNPNQNPVTITRPGTPTPTPTPTPGAAVTLVSATPFQCVQGSGFGSTCKSQTVVLNINVASIPIGTKLVAAANPRIWTGSATTTKSPPGEMTFTISGSAITTDLFGTITCPTAQTSITVLNGTASIGQATGISIPVSCK